jgi:hypothetical protein
MIAAVYLRSGYTWASPFNVTMPGEELVIELPCESPQEHDTIAKGDVLGRFVE